MLRITKIADYGIVLLAHMAGSREGGICASSELAEATHLPGPMVGKILKALTRAGLLKSHRGARGGYSLARDAETITVADIVGALDGPIALTECLASSPGRCEIEWVCPQRNHWELINDAVREALEKVTLADLARPMLRPHKVALHAGRQETNSPAEVPAAWPMASSDS